MICAFEPGFHSIVYMILIWADLSVPHWCFHAVFHDPLAHFTLLPFPKWFGRIQVRILHISHLESVYNYPVYFVYAVFYYHVFVYLNTLGLSDISGQVRLLEIIGCSKVTIGQFDYSIIHVLNSNQIQSFSSRKYIFLSVLNQRLPAGPNVSTNQV